MLRLVDGPELRVEGDEAVRSAVGGRGACSGGERALGGRAQKHEGGRNAGKPPKKWTAGSPSLAFVRLIRFCSLIYRKIFFWRMLSALHRIQELRINCLSVAGGKVGARHRITNSRIRSHHLRLHPFLASRPPPLLASCQPHERNAPAHSDPWPRT